MSGRNKRILYYVTVAVAVLAAIACAVLMALSTANEWAKLPTEFIVVFSVAAATVVILKPSVFVHELGHLFFGACAKLKCVGFSVGFLHFTRGKVRFRYSATAGETQFIPRTEKNLRRRMMAATLGGSLFNFIVGVVFCVLFFVLPHTPALVFFELLAPFQLYEGLAAILPVELNTGRTDGKMFSELKKNTAESEVFLRVMQAQGILEKNDYAAVPRELLFDAPVVREDSEAFLSLLHLRYEYLLYAGDEAGAGEQIFRLEELSDYLPEPERAQILCDAAFMRYVLKREKEFSIPQEAKGTLAYERVAAIRSGNLDIVKKIVPKERSEGTRTLEYMLIGKYLK